MIRIAAIALALIALRNTAIAAEPLERQVWKVGEVEREGLVYVPEKAKSQPAPIVFVFHGHGGTMRNAANKFAIHKHWPDAICVYPQGLNTPGRLVDTEGKQPGWQGKSGDQDDRDLKLFDTIFAALKTYKVDEQRIYTTGHSNGGGFTYLLWAQRPAVFAAVAPCAAITTDKSLKPKPVFHLAGEKDTLVKFDWQTRTIEQLKTLNGCGPAESWHDEKWCQQFPSKSKTPLVTCIHPGGHELPAEAGPLIAKFFQEQK